MTQNTSTALDGLPKRFVTAMRTLFDILDDQKTDCVRFSGTRLPSALLSVIPWPNNYDISLQSGP